MRIMEWIVAFFVGLASAGAVTAAVEAGRRPADADLRALGVDPQAFSTIGIG